MHQAFEHASYPSASSYVKDVSLLLEDQNGLCTEEGSLFASVKMVNNLYPVKLNIVQLKPA